LTHFLKTARAVCGICETWMRLGRVCDDDCTSDSKEATDRLLMYELGPTEIAVGPSFFGNWWSVCCNRLLTDDHVTRLWQYTDQEQAWLAYISSFSINALWSQCVITLISQLYIKQTT